VKEFEIVDLMQSLSKSRPFFHSEADFHAELFTELAARRHDRKGQVKAHIKTDRMPNKTRVEPDIVIDNFAIELKYVEVSEGKFPKDKPAQIPYDSIWDCAKLEALIDAGELADGIVIALTNYKNYWLDERRGGWARNFYLPDRGEWKCVGGPFKFMVEPGKAACKHPAIFIDERFHILLRHDWEYRWLPYNASFRYMVLRRKSGQLNPSRREEIDRWLEGAKENQLSSIPFINGHIRQIAMDFQRRFVASYVRNSRGQTRDCPICQRSLLCFPE
jgi:hypothetical protein